VSLDRNMLYLIRHGETTFNAEGRIQGQSDAPLSELGRRQSRAVAEALADVPIEAVYSSPLRRAWETAQCIAEPHRLAVETDPRLMELDAGVFEGRLRSELSAVYPAELARWLGGDEDFAIPGGESRRQLAERGCEALRAIAAAGHAHAAVVTHGGLLSTTLRALLDMPQPLPPFALKNGSITRLVVDTDGHFSLVAINEIEHLRGIGITRGGDL
jgi:2,3-bisphosphoglycerate-dependent phosphoglycerate mutase